MMEVCYKKWIRSITAKEKNGVIILQLPFFAKNDAKSHELAYQLWEKLQKKLNKKNKNQIFSSEGVLLFWERVSYKDLPSFKNEKSRSVFFKKELFSYADPFLKRAAQQLGYKDIPLTIRKVRSKWWSCTYDNRIMLNLSLIHLPTRLIQYVIIHEACHLVEKNHGSDFWILVEKQLPNFKILRKELKNQAFNFTFELES